MEVVRVLHMVGGLGETSYVSNSLLQKKAIAKTKPIVEQALEDLYSSILPNTMAVVDMGCSSGPNALLVASEIMDVVGEASRRLGRVPQEVQYFLNDLPGNDFNTLFRSLAVFQKKLTEDEGERTKVPFHFAGVPGSFYSRLFPKNSIHFVHSSYCLHYRSQVPRGVENEAGTPLNKRNIYLSQTSPAVVLQSYLAQFQKDFTSFLRFRSEEIIVGGRMVLVFIGRGNTNPLIGECSRMFELLANALTDMALEGLIEEAELDSFNLPFYFPSLEELRAVINEEGSFEIIECEVFELNWDPMDDSLENFVADNLKSGENVAKCMRAVLESMLTDHFGESIIDDLFSRFAKYVAMHLSKEKTKYVNLSISLKKKIKV